MAKAAPKTIKICLTNRGEDSETPWAQDLGPAPGEKKGSRKVRIVNVPFLHAKPTWGDIVIVQPVDDGLPTWDREGVPWKSIHTRIVEDGGRWAMIVDYKPGAGDATGDVAYRAVATACEAADVVCEGAFGPNGATPGRAYLAPRHETSAEDVMKKLLAAALPCELIQIHPPPAAPAKPKEPAPKPKKTTDKVKATAKKPAAPAKKTPPKKKAKR